MEEIKGNEIKAESNEGIKARKKGMPTPAFIGASWVALFLGCLSLMIGLWNADMMLNEKGYYLTLLLFGLFSAVSLQKQ